MIAAASTCSSGEVMYPLTAVRSLLAAGFRGGLSKARQLHGMAQVIQTQAPCRITELTRLLPQTVPGADR